MSHETVDSEAKQEVVQLPDEPLTSLADLRRLYDRLGSDDQSRIMETLRAARERFGRRDFSSQAVPGSFGSFVGYDKTEEVLNLSLSIIPGILRVRIAAENIQDVWDWLE